jgi:hypothetical protein
LVKINNLYVHWSIMLPKIKHVFYAHLWALPRL